MIPLFIKNQEFELLKNDIRAFIIERSTALGEQVCQFQENKTRELHELREKTSALAAQSRDQKALLFPSESTDP